MLRNDERIPAFRAQNLHQQFFDNADIVVEFFVFVLFQFLEYPLIIQKAQDFRGQHMFFRNGGYFQTDSGFNGLDFAAAVYDRFAAAKIPQESLVRHIENQTLCLLFEIRAVLHLDHMKLFVFGFLIAADHRQIEFQQIVVGRCAFQFEVLFEILHVLRFDAENRECFKQLNALGYSDRPVVQLAGAFEAALIALEPNAASEKLNGLGAFAFGKINESHCRNAPTVPAFRKLAGANQHFDSGIFAVDGAEQRIRNKFLRFGCYSFQVAAFDKTRRIADADHAEVFAVSGNLHTDFTRNLPETFQIQPRFFRTGIGIENKAKNVLEHRCRIGRSAENTQQTVEISIEKIVPSAVCQSGVFIQHLSYMGNRFGAFADEPIDKIKHFLHIGQLAVGCLGGNAVSDKDQKGLLYLKFPDGRLVGMVEL